MARIFEGVGCLVPFGQLVEVFDAGVGRGGRGIGALSQAAAQGLVGRVELDEGVWQASGIEGGAELVALLPAAVGGIEHRTPPCTAALDRVLTECGVGFR